jgi:hypothetical protein
MLKAGMSLSVQIETLFAQGLSAEEISRELDIEASVVRYELNRLRKLDEEDIPEEDFREIRQGLLGIAKHSEDDYLRARVGMFLWEQKRGSAKMRQGPPVNITQINQYIQAANDKLKNYIPKGDAGGNKGDSEQTKTTPEIPAESS